jgi:DNA-binding MarR family transcriptional regulator
MLNAAELRERLEAVLSELDRLRGEVPAFAGAPTARRIDAILKARRQRGQFFDPEIFADPAWDMLLELYAADLKAVRISVSQLCIASGVPPTTALRWMRSLEQKGLLRRTDDTVDGRRRYVFLTPRAIDSMTELLKACPPSELLL